MADIKEISIANNVYDIKTKNDHALKGYLDKGELLTDKEGLEDVKYYNRSTFDRSKFTIVGSPTITNDGIVSGFSSGNYLRTINSIQSVNSFEIVSPKFKTSVLNTDQFALAIGATNSWGFFCAILSTGKLVVALNISGTQVYRSDTTSAVANAEYQVKLRWDGAKYSVYLSTNDSDFIQLGTDLINSVAPSFTSSFIGVNFTGILPFLGSIDLKQFSIIVDGVEVFNGNKTGVDVIKADNFTKVGSPTISDDGIATFSSGNYLTSGNNVFDFSKSWEIETICNVIVDGTEQGIWQISGNNSFNFVYVSTANKIGFAPQTSTSTTRLVSNTVSSGIHKIIAGWDGSQYYLKVDNDATITRTDTEALTIATESRNINQIGRFIGNNSKWFKGSIDLNSFKIYVDGNLVYQPCLKIPYNQSKTGSKIVSATYRDRVQDMYEQFGWANYYTLSDTDFTLPMGEVYGMKVDKADLKECQVVIDTYINGTSGYRIWSDGYCEQWGYKGSTGTSYTISLLKTFKDTNYIVEATVTDIAGNYGSSTVSKSISSFVTFQDIQVDWKASGYLAEGQYTPKTIKGVQQ